MSIDGSNMTSDVCDDGVEEEEDDEHFCMKCKTIVRGIENYVEHRKVRCSRNTKVGPISFIHK